MENFPTIELFGPVGHESKRGMLGKVRCLGGRPRFHPLRLFGECLGRGKVMGYPLCQSFIWWHGCPLKTPDVFRLPVLFVARIGALFNKKLGLVLPRGFPQRYSSHLAQPEWRIRLSRAHSERLQRSCPTRGILNQIRACLNSFQLAENAYTVIEATTRIGTTGGFDVLTHPG